MLCYSQDKTMSWVSLWCWFSSFTSLQLFPHILQWAFLFFLHRTIPTVFITRVPFTGFLFSDSDSVFTYNSVSLSLVGVVSTGVDVSTGLGVSTFTAPVSGSPVCRFRTGKIGTGLVSKFFCLLFCICACAFSTTVDGPSGLGLVLFGVFF